MKDHWEVRDIMHWRKMKFQIPNLYRKIGPKCPHASYRNRGRYKMYMRIRVERYSKVMGYVEY